MVQTYAAGGVSLFNRTTTKFLHITILLLIRNGSADLGFDTKTLFLLFWLRSFGLFAIRVGVK